MFKRGQDGQSSKHFKLFLGLTNDRISYVKMELLLPIYLLLPFLITNSFIFVS